MNTENNKIIAEFMEVEKSKINANGKVLNFENSKYNTYHKDWNWLMEVVEEIESIKDSYHGRFGVYISSNSCTIQSTNFRPDKPIPNPPYYYDDVVLNSKIESTYNTVIRFINFYNKHKEK